MNRLMSISGLTSPFLCPSSIISASIRACSRIALLAGIPRWTIIGIATANAKYDVFSNQSRRNQVYFLILFSIVLTVLIEAVTVLLRFGLGMQSTEETASTVGRLTGGIRIHHGYLGVLAMLIAAGAARRHPAAAWLLVLGIALVASDLIHHFLVLWPIVGSPQFDLVYP